MTPEELTREAAKHGLRLELAGNQLAVFPKGKCPPDFAETLRQNKSKILKWLSRSSLPGWKAVPPCDLPLIESEPHPSLSDRERVIRYLLQQTDDRPGPLSAWLVRRETTYYDGPGSKWDCSSLAYAAARDAACWQLKRTETELWELLVDP